MVLLTITDLSSKLGGRSRSSIYRDVETGRLPPPIKLGGRLLWPEDEIDRALEKLIEERSGNETRPAHSGC